MKLLAFLLTTILITNLGPNCLTSSEEFSSEVVIPTYSLQNLNQDWEITQYGYSKFDSNTRLIELLSDSSNPKGLSVRIQIPTEVVEYNQPLLRIVSTSATGIIRPNVGNEVNGWSINCKDQVCSIEKNDVTIQTDSIGNEIETSVEIRHPLSSCNENCRGTCITATQDPVCIDLETKQDLDTIIKYLNLSNNFNELLNNYRITSEFLQVREISPLESGETNWKSAMQSTLLDLKNSNVISITDQDVEQISNLAKRGQAGERYRIVKDAVGVWTYYYKLPGAKITSAKDCKSYELLAENSPKGEDGINTFYLIPIILVSSALFLLLVLIIVSRTIRKKYKHRKDI